VLSKSDFSISLFILCQWIASKQSQRKRRLEETLNERRRKLAQAIVFYRNMTILKHPYEKLS